MERAPPAVPITFYRHRVGALSSFALLAAAQLDLFTALKDGPRSAADLAAEIGAKSDKLSLLLYALVQAGLLELRDGAFANTAESGHFLARGAPGYVGEWHRLDQDLWQAAMLTATTLRSGEPQGWHDFTAMSDAAMAEFFGGLHGSGVVTGKMMATSHEFGRFDHLLDVGGGSGGVAIGACQAVAGLRATVIDLPRVIAIADDYIAKAGLGVRIAALAADVVAAPPPCRFDAAIMRSFIQVLSRDDARRALGNVGRAMAPGGSLFIIGHVVDDSRVAPASVAAYNLIFLNVYRDGEAYTAGEYHS